MKKSAYLFAVLTACGFAGFSPKVDASPVISDLVKVSSPKAVNLIEGSGATTVLTKCFLVKCVIVKAEVMNRVSDDQLLAMEVAK